MISAFIHGFILAFGLILPLGVQNVFIFTQGAMTSRFIHVLPIVLVASLCDTILILLAVFGVSLIVLTVSWFKMMLVIAGILFLFFMGWITWKSDSRIESDKKEQNNWTIRKQILFTLSVSLLNPHAILDTIGVIGINSLSYAHAERGLFALACIVVSWIWFFTLAMMGRMVGSMDKAGKIRLILNKASALIMWVSAIYLLFSIV